VLSSIALAGGEAGSQKSGLEWKWNECAGDLVHSTVRMPSDYEVIIRRPARKQAGSLHVTVKLRQAASYDFQAHEHTVFAVDKNRLFWVKYNPGASGGHLVAVDMATGDELWTQHLKSLGEIAHSTYKNRIQIEMNKGVITVYGRESQGSYIEAREANSGNLIKRATVGSRPTATNPAKNE